jgi:chaperonin GroES
LVLSDAVSSGGLSPGRNPAARRTISLPIAFAASPGPGARMPEIRSKECCFMSFRPLHDRVLIRRIDQDEKTKGGIIIPDTAKEKPQEGEVVAVGPGLRDEAGKLQPLDVKAGDRVLFGKWSGTEIKLEGTDFVVLKESDVIGVFEAAKRPSKKAA